MKGNQKGFTMVEMMVALLLMSFIAYLALQVATASTDTLRSATDTMAMEAVQVTILEDLQDLCDSGNLSQAESVVLRQLAERIGAEYDNASRSVSVDAGSHKFNTHIELRQEAQYSGRAAYLVTLETHIGGATYRKLTTRVVLAPQTKYIFKG